MTYKVKLTNNALAQLKEAVGYISKVLLEPEVARRWSDRIKKEILTLDHMPLRSTICRFAIPLWMKSRGERKAFTN